MSSTVSRRLLLVPAVALLVGLGAGCADDVSPAVSVDGVKVSERDFLDEVGEWAHNPQAYPEERLAGHNPGTYPMDLVTAILGQRIDLTLTHEEFERLGLKLTDEDRQQAVGALFQGDLQTAETALGGFSDSYKDEYVDLISEQLAVQTKLGDTGYSAWRDKAYRESDIDVSPKYGTWDGTQGAVKPPTGPSQPAGTVELPAG